MDTGKNVMSPLGAFIVTEHKPATKGETVDHHIERGTLAPVHAKVPARDFVAMSHDQLLDLFTNSTSVNIDFSEVVVGTGEWGPLFNKCGSIVQTYRRRLRRDGLVINQPVLKPLMADRYGPLYSSPVKLILDDSENTRKVLELLGMRVPTELHQRVVADEIHHYPKVSDVLAPHAVDNEGAGDTSYCLPEKLDMSRIYDDNSERLRASIESASFNRAKPTAKGWPGAVAGADIQSGQLVKIDGGVAVPLAPPLRFDYDTEQRPDPRTEQTAVQANAERMLRKQYARDARAWDEQAKPEGCIINQNLVGVNPFDPGLSAEVKLAIFQECAQNPEYFFMVVHGSYPLNPALKTRAEIFKNWTMSTETYTGEHKP
jgi:hypothetical protein